jgi:FtsZ-interacting cell division protein ZipA
MSMNELQLGLIGLGTVAVAGVVAYNKWQERRHRKVAEQVLQRNHADVLLGGDAADIPRSEAAISAPDIREDEPHLVPMISAERASMGARMEPSVRMEPVLSADDLEQPPWEDVDHSPEPVLEDVVEPTLSTEPPVADSGFREAASVPAGEGMPRISVANPAGEDEIPAIIVSPAIDYMASFELVEAASGAQLLHSQHELLARVSKPIGWAGYNDRTREWERVVGEGSYRRLRVGLLLADRRGPLGEADLLTFHAAMQNLAEELMAVADLPPRDAALDAAIALDQFCANVDIQVGLNVISQGQVFPGTKIRALAEAAGMVLDASGRFVRCDDDGHVLYTLANQESAGFSVETMRSMSTHGLVFILDVPCVSHGDRVFAQMLDLARRMAETLHGVLVDDNRRPLTEAMLDPFRRQIGQYQSQLAAKGLPAGCPLTLRLFT